MELTLLLVESKLGGNEISKFIQEIYTEVVCCM